MSSSLLETTTLVNSSNPTLVAAWDVGAVPETAEATDNIVLRFNGSPEILGPDGDRRKKVDAQHFKPGGKYRAVCKLFMGYTNTTETYMGTGWLIADDLLVTAGHCSYDAQHGYLKWMKVYIGYAGPESVGTATCQYRQATSVAMPAEYLKAATVVHDVSFIKLRTRFDGVSNPIQYEDTPQLQTTTLGVVGYPGELSFGNYMYEHWDTVQIDLAKSHGILEYKVDTTGGQSGSPVFRTNLKSIGVHVVGAWPNEASVIGTLGNIFAEYLLAMKAHSGVTVSGTKIVSPTAPSPVKGFQMITVASLSKESAKLTGGDMVDGDGVTNGNAMNGDEDVEDAEVNTESALAKLFGSPDVGKAKNSNNNSRGARSRDEVAMGQFLDFPEPLVITEDAPATPPTNSDLAAATLKDQATADIQTVFFINFPPDFGDDDKARASLQEIDDLVKSWQSWSSVLCEGKVQDMINDTKLPGDDSAKSMSARSTYRSKVFDYLMRSATWFAKTFDQVMSKHIECQKFEFHGEIFKAALQGFSVPTSVFSVLEKVLDTVVDGVIKASSEKSSDGQQYWMMMTRYEYQPLLKRVSPVIRVISFKVNSETTNYVVGKSSYSSVKFDMAFGQYQCDFNAKIYKAISATYDQELIEKGMKLAAMKTTDIPVPV